MYRELAPPPVLRAAVRCLWERDGGDGYDQLIVPDGCVDLIWSDDGRLFVAGPDTAPRTSAIAPLRSLTGIRLRPGYAGAFFGVPAGEFSDIQADAVQLEGFDDGELTDRLAAGGRSARRDALAAAVLERGVTPDPLVIAAAARLTRPGARVGAVAADLGVSARQLQRRTVDAVGYGPKFLARVQRLELLTRVGVRDLAEGALAAGYASQAHMGDEVRALTGMSAGRYLARFAAAH